MSDEGEDAIIDPRFRVVQPWSEEQIERWKFERRRNYPTQSKFEAANRIKAALQEKRRKIREARENDLRDRNSRELKRKPRKQRHPYSKRKRFDHQTQPRRETTFQFPDFDYEEEGFKDGIIMFPGTVKAMKADQDDLNNSDIPISDDEEDTVGYYRSCSLMEEDENEVTANLLKDTDQQNKIPAVKTSKMSAFDSDDNDAPEVQKIQHISELATGSNVIKSSQCKKNTETQSTKQKEKSYSEILKRPRRPTTLLETLLDSEIKQERYDLLQCIHYVVSNNFFGIGANKK